VDTSAVGYVIEGSFALGVLGFMWKVAGDSNKKAETIFRRFDEYKKEVKTEFVSKEGCGIRHDQITRDLQEIKTDVKILLRNGNHEPKR